MSAIGDTLYNAFTGNLSQSQKQALTNQETQDLIQAGADPTTAAAQAQSDVNSALTTYQGPGALALNWTGAEPGGPNAFTAATSAVTGFLESNWIWLLLGAIALIFILWIIK